MKKLFSLVFIALIFFSIDAFSFPDLIRSGYQSCKPCHYSPSGGGQITKYGRVIAGDHLSTWGTPEEAEAFYGYVHTDPLDFSANYRYLYHHLENDQVRITQRFAMQREISIAFNPSKNVSIVASGGLYGPDPKKAEYRTYYGIINLESMWVRGGRYLAPFGLEIEDHTKGIKEFLGQGKETVNFEGGYSNKWFEASLTRVLGENPGVRLDSEPTIEQKTDWNGYTAKLSIFPTNGVQLGVSHAMTDNGTAENKYSSIHAFAGLERLYSQAEYQIHPEHQFKTYGMIGFQAFKGFHIRAEVDSDKNETETFGTLLWFPRPHFQLTASASKVQQYFVFHFYL